MLKNTRKICGIAAGLSLVSLWGTNDLPLSIPTAEAVYNSEVIRMQISLIMWKIAVVLSGKTALMRIRKSF